VDATRELPFLVMGWLESKKPSPKQLRRKQYYRRKTGSLRKSNLFAFSHRDDGDILEWHQVFLMIQDGSFDEKTLLQTMTLDCWMLEVQLENDSIGGSQHWVAFDSVKLGALGLDNAQAKQREEDFVV
jgi:hypothetical protein